MISKEKDLVDQLAGILKERWSSNYTFREIHAGYGIADLVLAKGYHFYPSPAAKTPIAHYQTLQLLLNMKHGRPYSRSALIRYHTGVSKSTLSKRLKFLVENQYIKKENNKYARVVKRQSFRRMKEIIAIEAKLHDHKQGLLQARRYQFFADKSYLAILERHRRDMDLNKFRALGIGVLVFNDKTKELKQVVPARKNRSLYQSGSNILAQEILSQRFMSGVASAS